MTSIFSGSYASADVEFLLTLVTIEVTPIEEKEALIQSGEKHYSDMLSQEPAPSREHLMIYQQALQQGEQRLANEVWFLAQQLIQKYQNRPIVLASLVRAGVPLGVMLQRTLRHLGHESYHYGISIIRDRGIDLKALEEIEKRHNTQDIIFVDGWTGKGAILNQLNASLSQRVGYMPSSKFLVLADPCGIAWMSASQDDWLIPFGILGAAVSGLISRSLWSEKSYHGCVLCEHLSEFECGTQLVERILDLQISTIKDNETNTPLRINSSLNLHQQSRNVIAFLQQEFNVDSINRIKPGIAEATRAVLRRVPDHILIRDETDPDIALLLHLAKKKKLPITVMGKQLGQYRAVTIIKKVR